MSLGDYIHLGIDRKITYVDTFGDRESNLFIMLKVICNLMCPIYPHMMSLGAKGNTVATILRMKTVCIDISYDKQALFSVYRSSYATECAQWKYVF